MKVRMFHYPKMAVWVAFKLRPTVYRKADGRMYGIGLWARLGWRYVSAQCTWPRKMSAA